MTDRRTNRTLDGRLAMDLQTPTESFGLGWVFAGSLLVAGLGCSDESPDDGPSRPGGDATLGDLASPDVRDGRGSGDADATTAACTYFPDSCPAGENCYGAGDGRDCAEYEPDAALGDRCEKTNECDDGHRCLDRACRPICDPDGTGDDGCRQQRVCVPLEAESGESLNWGVCLEETDRCEAWPNDDCGAGETCVHFSYGLRCRPYDAGAAVGDRCDQSVDCSELQVCASAPDAETSRCREKCDEEHPCETGRCLELRGASHGACFPTGD